MTTAKPKTERHILRTLCASLFGFLALVLIFISIIVVWLNQTLTNQAVFTNTISPLASNSAIQNFITEKATDQILASASPQDLAQALLTADQVNGKTDQQLTASLQPAAAQVVRGILASPQFQSLWTQTVSSAHQQFLDQLNANAPTITLDLHPAVMGVLNELQATKLQPLGTQLNLPADTGELTLQGDTIEKVHMYYNLFQEATLAIVGAAILLAAACILISVHHLKTLRRITIGIGVMALVLAAILQAPTLVAQSADSTEEQAALAVSTTLFHNLQLICLVVGIGCIVAALASKVISLMLAKRATALSVH